LLRLPHKLRVGERFVGVFDPEGRLVGLFVSSLTNEGDDIHGLI
jgi:hypothetical protein